MKYTSIGDLYTHAPVSKACLPPPNQLRNSPFYYLDSVPRLSSKHKT